ncbi:hypothetical protein [Sulfurimonas sp.]|uniref:hypothetical protein n=1 Tax=Sulfurimonas sp. TaxID=2022749 RepID=UPI002B49A586|nr:hypothetical protein [Sulfurimonas sp.]
MNLYEEKLIKIFNECDKHIIRITSSSGKMKSNIPLNKDKYLNLLDDEVEYIDQFLFRFSKLQDSIGEKLFKTILLYLDEKIENKPFIDILNRLEKLELLDDVNVWRELRDDRNNLAHNYDDDPEETSEVINKLYSKKEMLINIYQHIKDFYNKRQESNQ